MEKIMIVFVSIAFLVGLVGGYAVHYPQIQNVQNALSDVKNQIQDIQNDLDGVLSVNVTNFSEAYEVVNYVHEEDISWERMDVVFGIGWSFVVPDIFVQGYSTVVIYITIDNVIQGSGATTQFGIRDLNWREGSNKSNIIQRVWSPLIEVTGSSSFGRREMVKFETYGPYLFINLGVYAPDSSGSAIVSIDAYLRN